MDIEITKEDIDGSEELWVTTSVEQGISITIHEDFIREDETLEEYIKSEVKEESLDRIVREIADGIRKGKISIKKVEHE